MIQEGGIPVGEPLTSLVSKPELFLEHSIRSFPTLLPWEVAVICGVDQWDSSPESRDSHTYQLDSLHHSLYANYINKLFSTAEESVRVRGILPSMFRGDTQLLLNTLSVLLQLGQTAVNAPTDSSVPR